MDRKRIIAGGIIVVVLIGVLVYALVHSSSPAPTSKPAPVVHPETSQSKPAAPQSSGSGNAGGSSSSASSQQALNNTGPGDVALVFAVASIIGYGTYLRLVLRRERANER